MKRHVAAIELAVAAVLLVAHHVVMQRSALASWMVVYVRNSAERINPGEQWFLLLGLVTSLPAAILAADALARWSLGETLRTIALRAPKRTIAIAAAFAAVGSIVVASRVLEFAAFTDDERVYLFQARTYLDGHITALAPTPRHGFGHQFVVPVGAERWAGIFPPGQPALLAIGLLVGHANLTQYLCVAAIVWVTASFVSEEWGDESAVLVAALLALSPALVFSAATLHNVVPVVLCVALVVRHTARLLRGDAQWNALVVGAAAGAAFLCRPLDGVLLAAWAAGAIVVRAPRRSPLLLAAAAGLPFLAAQLLVYRAISGDALTTPYRVWLSHDWPRAKLFGFGPTVWNYEHTPRIALSKTAAALTRVNLWAFGWPLSLLPLIAAFTFRAARDRMLVALLALIGLHVGAYFFYAFGAVHDFGSYYHLFWLPALAAVSARVIVVARSSGAPRAELAENAAVAATIVGLLTFVPAQVRRLRPLAALINEPIALARAAAHDTPVVVFYDRATPWNTSWVHWNDLPGPRGDGAILWARTNSERLKTEVVSQHPSRRALQLEWVDGHARLRPWAPLPSPVR